MSIFKKTNLVFVLTAVCLSVVCVGFYYSQAQVAEYDLSGWLWSENYGWFSLSSENCSAIYSQDPSNLECAPNGDDGNRVQYQVKVDSSNNISGYGWSSNVGWVCFGATCLDNNPLGESSSLVMNEITGQIEGWAQILSLGDEGWVHFNRGVIAGSNEGQICYDCQPICLEWTQSCSLQGDPPQEVCENIEPCLSYSEDYYDSCDFCFSRTFFNGENIPDSGVDSVVGGSGYFCSDCRGSGSSGTDDQYCYEASDLLGSSRVVCSDCSNCQLYGSGFDSDNDALVGWGWNGSDNDATGAGWIHLSNGWGPAIAYPWLETQYGSIYSSQDIRQRGSSIKNNATYCIFAENIQGVSSANCQTDSVGGVDLLFPSGGSGESYYGALGKIDVAGLITPINVIINKNKYGHFIENINSSDLSAWSLSGGKIMEEKVYFSDGDLTLSDDLLIKNGDGENGNGSGLVVVNGDLYLNANLSYESSIPSDLKDMASISWVVKGDVIVADSVENLVGAFVLLGDGGECVSDGQDYPRYDQNGCGVFFSGESDQNLTVLGLIVARAFDFRRFFADSQRGSERIIYDGRLNSNPPPGLTGFTEGLPIIRDFTF